MEFEYRHKNYEYRKSAPIDFGTTYSFEKGKNPSRKVYFSIVFLPTPPAFLKSESKFKTGIVDFLITRLNKWLTRDIKHLLITLSTGTEKSEHKILFSGNGKYNFIHSDVFVDWVDVISTDYASPIGSLSIQVRALDASGKVLCPPWILGKLFISEPLFLKSNKGKNIVFITAESLNDFDYLLKEKMISADTYQLYKKVFANFTVIDRGVSQGDWTFPISFTYHTGLMPSQHKMFNSKRICAGIDKLNGNIATLSEMLKKEGYLTFSATVGRCNVEYGFAKGFDFYFKPPNWLVSDEYTGDDKWIIKKLEHFESNCFIHVHIDRLHAPFCTTTEPWGRVKKLSTPQLADDDTLINPESYYEKNLRFLLLEMNTLISYLKLNNAFEETIFIFTADHGTAIGEWFNICQRNSLVDSRVRIPYLINQKTAVVSKNANIRHIHDIGSLLGTPLPAYLKTLPQNQEAFASYSFSEAILKTRKDLYVLAIRNEAYTYFFFADIDWQTFSVTRFVEEYVVSSQDGSTLEDPALLKQFTAVRETYFELNQKFYLEMYSAMKGTE